ncbi:hypothetical protein ElyMa_001827700 [Elysia marginata]|uniref:Uncharacterized protein n=1 Tax=Elysia marginata TaxID=1093978 RepID=A0AAV4EHX9_9GAST|nr:hypothetical protein ElyMa_001827700 [Elysia marginata]
MTMFHLQYPASKTFLTWDELGCLCRALGLPVDLFQRHFPTDVFELQLEEHGIYVKTIRRLFELNLLQKALHRTYNFHTADWNVCVITRALYMLEHRVLDYEGLHDVRVAYGTYEHVDMKGLVIHKHILLRTLKMCGRSIAPLKLMHRIKHMKGEFEEKGRIQLYEFFNLIVWCDLYTAYDPQEAETSEGKEEDLFKLVDFDRLLSHHDERVAARLNAQFLAEEWDFGMEVLAGKEMFKEPPVYTEGRISQAKYHKQNYKALKKEVNHSQKRLYRAYAGSIRSRPISAPDLDNYRHHVTQKRHVESSAHEAYESVRRRLNSAPSRASTHRSGQPPQIVVDQYERVSVTSQPRAVTSADLSDVRRKMEDLQFNINTLESRCKLQVENEMEFYIPGYLEKLANKKPEEPPLPEPEKKARHWTSKIINNLAYPASNLKAAHAKNCDARYRGWLRANSKPGWHAVITSHTHQNSDKGRQYAKLEQKTLEPVQYTHQDYVIRYTPYNWPGLANAKPIRKTETSGGGNQNQQQQQQQDQQKQQQQQQALPNFRFQSLEKQEEDGAGLKDDNQSFASVEKEKKPLPDLSFFHNKYLSDSAQIGETESVPPQDTRKEKRLAGSPEKESLAKQPQSFPRGLEASQRRTLEPAEEKCFTEETERPDVVKAMEDRLPLGSAGVSGCEDTVEWTREIPIPHMEHSKPKLVGVGQIGTIALLENIEESRDLEENWIENDNADENQDDPLQDLDAYESEDEKGEILRPVSQSGIRQPKKVKGRPSKSQPSSNQQIREVASALKNRPSRSAPQRRTGTASPKRTPPKVVSPRRTPPKIKSPRQNPPGKPRNGTGQTGEYSKPNVNGDEFGKTAQNMSLGTKRSKFQETSSSESLHSPVNSRRQFKAMRGSVTSEEEETEKEQSSGTLGKGHKTKGKGASDVDKSQSKQASAEDDDQSSYSDALTIASSDGLSDLPASPPAGSRGLPMINVSLDKKSDTLTTPRSVLEDLATVVHAPKIHFNLVNMRVDIDGKCGDTGSGSSSLVGDREIPFRHSSASHRKDSLVIHYDLREYLSDSEPRRAPTFSRESRARLVGRVENAISPDLKHKLMAGDPGLVA